MALPKYDGFYSDLRKLYDKYSQVTFAVGSSEAQAWKTMLDYMKQVIDSRDDLNLVEYEREEKWDKFTKALSQCTTRDLWVIGLAGAEDKSPKAREKAIEPYNAEFSEEKLERWKLDRTAYTLYYRVQELENGQTIKNDLQAMGNYINSSVKVLGVLEEFGDEIKPYESFEKLYEKYKDDNKALNDCQDALDALLQQMETTEDIEENNVELLNETRKQLALRQARLENEISSLQKDVDRKGADILKAQRESEEVLEHADEINAEHQRQADILKEKKKTLDDQAEKTAKSVIEEKKVSAVISNAAQQNYEAQQKIDRINKEYKRTQTFLGKLSAGFRGIFSSSVKEETQEIKKRYTALTARTDLDTAVKNAELVRSAFDGLVRPGEKVDEMVSLGKVYSSDEKGTWANHLKMPNNEYSNRRSLQAYRKKLELEALLRKALPTKLSNEEKEKVEKRLKTYEGMIKLADELVDLRNGIVERLQFDKDYIEQMQEVEALTIMQKMNNEHIKGTETAIEDLQTGLKKDSNRLYQKEQDVKEQEKVVKKSSLESKLAVPLEQMKKEADKYGDLENQKKELEKQLKEKQTEKDHVKAELKRWENRLELRAQLRTLKAQVAENKALYGKLLDFKGKYTDMVEKGKALKDTIDKRGNVLKGAIDENGKYGRVVRERLRTNVKDGLNVLYNSSFVGKERDHKDTPAYRGMMDQYDTLMANDCEAMKNMSSEELLSTLTALKKGADDYIKAKQEQWFQSFRHSPMRKARLDFAERLKNFCDEQTDAINEAEKKIKNVQKIYDDNIKTFVEKWPEKTEMEDVFKIVKKSVDTMQRTQPEVEQRKNNRLRSKNTGELLKEGKLPGLGNG